MVGDREPRRRRVGLIALEGAVVGVQEAIGRAEHDGRADDRLRDAAVADRHQERPALADALGGRDLELLPVARELRAAQVDGHRGHVELLQVEVEARQILRGARGDHREALEPVRRRVVRERQVVVLRVVAPVALQREIRVAYAGVARLVVGATVAVAPGLRVRRATRGARGRLGRRHISGDEAGSRTGFSDADTGRRACAWRDGRQHYDRPRDGHLTHCSFPSHGHLLRYDNGPSEVYRSGRELAPDEPVRCATATDLTRARNLHHRSVALRAARRRIRLALACRCRSRRRPLRTGSVTETDPLKSPFEPARGRALGLRDGLELDAGRGPRGRRRALAELDDDDAGHDQDPAAEL